MVVPGVVNAIAAEEIQNLPAVGGMQHFALTPNIGAVEVEQVQEVYPARVDAPFISVRIGARTGTFGVKGTGGGQ
jgi:hypothetical protein